MTTKKARKEARKPLPPPPRNTTGVEMAMVETMAPPGGDVNHHLPSLVLPPGVYFNPGPEESVQTYLNRWIAGQEMPDIQGIIIRDDVYRDNPEVLLRRYRPANTRNSSPKWWFLCECKLQATRGGKSAHRGRRGVATGGYWKLEQTKKKLLVGGELLGFRRSFGFYVSGQEEDDEKKTRWLMEEYTSCGSLNDEGTGTSKNAMPALYKMYVTPRDPGKKKRTRDGEDGVPMGQGGKAVRVMVPTAYFDAIAALLPPSSVRRIGQAQELLQGTGEAPPPPGVLCHFEEQFLEPAPPMPPPPPGIFGHFEGRFLEPAPAMPPPPPGVFAHFEGQFLEAAPPLNVLGHCHDHYQGQFIKLTVDASPDNQSMPVNQLFALPEEQGTAETSPPLSLSCVLSMGGSPDDDRMTIDETFGMLKPLEEQGSTGGDCQRGTVPVSEDIPQWQMMEGDALADTSWIEDYMNLKCINEDIL